MLKKQTVWLLTMLSLMIVLSVYYIMIDKDDQQAIIDTNLSENSATSGEGNGNNVGNGNNEDNDQGLTGDNNNESNDQGLAGDSNKEDDNEGNNESDDNSVGETPDVSDFTNLGKDELFTMNRMEIQDERSKKIGYLEEVMASANATTDEKNKALEDIYKIDETNTKEYILQNTIMSKQNAYQDVLVRSENDMVYVHVMTDELSKSEAVDIMQLVRDEFGEVTVDVKYN